MKKLQSNFTTPEQSKRLLELGVPADSADCYINLWNNYPYGILADDESYSDYKFAGYINDSKVLPCWSVGRLIEILKECINNEDELIDIFVELQYSNNLLTTVLMIFRDNKAILDFSKLEE